tara:strand:+ start:276 stop:401 length:126 start_codon:yes stop_codon:yes gene_type:complete
MAKELLMNVAGMMMWASAFVAVNAILFPVMQRVQDIIGGQE